VFVINQDERGATLLLFPHPGGTLQNPLEPNRTHRLPGAVGGIESNWKVSTAGGREHFVVLASPDAVPAIESMLAALPAPQAGQAVEYPALDAGSIERLRAVGGLSPVKQAGPSVPMLFGDAAPLTARTENVSGFWARRLTLENPGR
jgi:hypothetical protein